MAATLKSGEKGNGVFCDSGLSFSSNLTDRNSRSVVRQWGCDADFTWSSSQKNAAAPSPDIPQRPAVQALVRAQKTLY